MYCRIAERGAGCVTRGLVSKIFLYIHSPRRWGRAAGCDKLDRDDVQCN